MLITPAASAKEISTNIYWRSVHMKVLLCLIAFLACTATPAAQSNSSVYTALGEKQCRAIKAVRRNPDDGFAARCQGAAGYTLLVSEGDLRQNITVVTPAGEEHSLDLWRVVSS